MLSIVQEVIAHWIAECRLMIEQTRLLTLNAAHALDTLGSRAARKEVKLFLTLTFKNPPKQTHINVLISYLGWTITLYF